MTVPYGDTPDEQFGIVTNQQPIASFPAATIAGTVTLQPNTETLVIAPIPSAGTAQLETAVGVTTGIHYDFLETDLLSAAPFNVFYLISTAPAIDEQLTLTWSLAPPNGWKVWSDAGIRVTYDGILYSLAAENGEPDAGFGLSIFGQNGGNNYEVAVDTSGRLINSPLGPLDHNTTTVGNGGQLLAAPTAGTMNRIYQLVVSVVNVPEVVFVTGAVSGSRYAAVPIATANAPIAMNIPIPLDSVEGLTLGVVLVNQNITYSVHWRNLPTQ